MFKSTDHRNIIKQTKTDHSHHLLNKAFFAVLKSNIYNIHNAPAHTMKADNGQAAKSSKAPPQKENVHKSVIKIMHIIFLVIFQVGI